MADNRDDSKDSVSFILGRIEAKIENVEKVQTMQAEEYLKGREAAKNVATEIITQLSGKADKADIPTAYKIEWLSRNYHIVIMIVAGLTVLGFLKVSPMVKEFLEARQKIEEFLKVPVKGGKK